MKRKIKVCSLFSGIGGFETGVFQAVGQENCEVVFASEIDKFAARGYEYLYNHRPFGDVRLINEKDVPDHDLLLAGFPCQSFSMAGKRLGLKDTRGTLFFEVARIAKEKQPKAILLENVTGLLSDAEGDTIFTILHILSEMGYKVDIEVLNSKHFHVAQNRERVFIVALKDVEGEEWNVNSLRPVINKLKTELSSSSEIQTFNFNYPKNNVVDRRIRDILEENVPEKYYMKKEVTNSLLREIQEALHINKFRDTAEIDKMFDIPKDILNDNERQRRVYNLNGIAPTVLARPDTPKILLLGYLDMKAGKQIRSVYNVEGLSPTVDTAQGGHRQIKVFIEPEFEIRKLTPLEVLRLQGFPDHYYEKLREINISDTQMYKMAGNAVTTNVIEGIVRNLKEYL